MPDLQTVYDDGYEDGFHDRIKDLQVSGEDHLVKEYWRGYMQGKADREEVGRAGSSNT